MAAIRQRADNADKSGWVREGSAHGDRVLLLVEVDALLAAAGLQPEELPEPIGRVRRKWWRLGWLSAMAVVRGAVGPGGAE